jgi:hypothetical protein
VTEPDEADDEPVAENEDAASEDRPESFARFVAASRHENTQFARICMLFLESDNMPMTLIDIARGIDASKSAVANILYRTQRGAFVSERVPGHRRLRVWTMHPQLLIKLISGKLAQDGNAFSGQA